jgi:hypothetical protein
MVVKVLTISKQEFSLGFKLTVFGSDDLVYVGCFDLDSNLYGYGLEQSSSTTENVTSVSEKVHRCDQRFLF